MSQLSSPASVVRTDAGAQSVARGRVGGFDVGTLLVVLVLAGCVGLTGWGVWQHRDTLQIAWQHDGRVAVMLGVFAASGWMALASLLRLPMKAMLVALALLIAASAMGLGGVAAALLIVISAAQAGLLVLPAEQIQHRSPTLVYVVAIAVGLAIFAGLLQITARLPIHYPLIYLVALLLPFGVMPAAVKTVWRGLAEDLRARSQAPVDGWNFALWTIAAVGSLIRLLGVLAPEAGLDALDMHLQMPTMLARDHAWVPASSGFVWAWMPMSVDWIYAIGYVLAGEPAARLLNYAADVLILLGCAQVARISAGARAGAMAAALYSSLPITYLLTTSLFVENLWALWVGCALLVTTALRAETGGRRSYVVLGLLFGAALAAKVITAFWAPLVIYFAWERLRSKPRGAAKLLILTALVALVVGGWPYAVAWLETGNPVFPFMNDIFRSPLYPDAAGFTTTFQHGASWRLLYDLTFATDKYIEAPPGAFGLTMLAVLPAGLLAAAWRGGRWGVAMVLAALLFVAIAFSFTSYLRYVAPVFPVLAILIAIGLESLRPVVVRRAIAAVVVVTGAAGLALFANSTWWYRNLPPLGPLNPVAYRGWEAHMRPEATLVRRANEVGAKNVLWLGRGFYAGLQAKITTNSWHQQSGWASLSNASDLDKWVASKRFDAVVIAADFNACATAWVCEFVERLGEPELAAGSAKLYRVPPSVLYVTEKLKDTELLGQEAAWGGNGEWDKTAGSMRVSGDKLFSQAVSVIPARGYLYSVKARCIGEPAQFRKQVNWLRADGSLVEPVIVVDSCNADWREHEMPLVAPPGAALAVVYAVGHTPDQFVEVDAVSLRE